MKKRNRIISVLIVFLLVCILLFYQYYGHTKAAFSPDYPKTDITSLLEKPSLTETDYQRLLYQTGLGKSAIDDMIKDTDLIRTYQDAFFLGGQMKCTKVGAITKEDRNAALNQYTELVPLQEGDILLTFSTHTLGWRHGHAGLVIDGEKEQVLEAAILGSDSQIMSLSHWRRYSNFMVLRLKDASRKQRKEIAVFAKENLNDIPYRLFSGIFGEKVQALDGEIGAQCAYLVWYPYQNFGYDLDSDGGRVVTVDDLAGSQELEIVQLYGIDPKSRE